MLKCRNFQTYIIFFLAQMCIECTRGFQELVTRNSVYLLEILIFCLRFSLFYRTFYVLIFFSYIDAWKFQVFLLYNKVFLYFPCNGYLRFKRSGVAKVKIRIPMKLFKSVKGYSTFESIIGCLIMQAFHFR